MIMAAINQAVEELIEQVPAADGFETKLIKEKVELLKDMMPASEMVVNDHGISKPGHATLVD